MTVNKLTVASALGAIACLGANVPVAHSQQAAQSAADASGSDQLMEIVVTAEHRLSDVQKTADSLTVLEGGELRSEGRYALSQILEDVAGVQGTQILANNTASGSDTAASNITIRGIQSNQGAMSVSAAPAAAVYVDGVYEGVGGGYDIDQVEVLRGPQGTLYGRSATSGLVAIHTADPHLDEFGGDVSLEAGDYSLQHYTGAVNLPLDDVFAVRIAANRYQRDGFYGDDNNALTTTDGRVKLLYQPNSDLSVLVGVAGENNVTRNGDTTVLLPPGKPNTYDFVATPTGTGNNQFRQYWATVNWNLGFATLTYEPALRTWESHNNNYTQSFLLLNQTTNTPRDHFHTEELRLTSDNDQKVTWQVGTMYYENDLANSNIVDIVTPPLTGLAFDSELLDKNTRALGLYSEATYHFADAWRLTAGARYDNTRVGVDQNYTSSSLETKNLSGEAGIRRFNNVTYKVRLEHDLTPKNLVYGSVSTGFSPGDIAVATGSDNNPIVLELKAETLTAYEVGSKNRFLGDTLQVNGATYFYHYSGYQTTDVNVTPNGLTPTNVSLSSPAQSFGGELETIYKITSDDRVGLDLSYVNARYTDKNGTEIAIGPGSNVTFADFFSLDRIPMVVPFTANLYYDHSFRLPGGSALTFHGDVRFLSAHELSYVPAIDPGWLPYNHVAGQVVGDLNLMWASSDKKYFVTTYLRNVGNNQYKNYLMVQQNVYTTIPYDPRTYGIVLNARF